MNLPNAPIGGEAHSFGISACPYAVRLRQVGRQAGWVQGGFADMTKCGYDA